MRRYDLSNYSDSLSTTITDPFVYYRRAGIPIHTYILAYHPQASERILSFLESKHAEQVIPANVRTAIVTTPKASSELKSNTFDNILAVDELRDFEAVPGNRTIYILPPTLGEDPARNLRHILQQSIVREQEIIIPLSYILNLQESDRRIIPLLNEFINQETPIFALSENANQSRYMSLTIISLVICWLVFGMFFFGNGHYYRRLTRYLLTHNFYVNDVMNRRLKTENDLIISIFVVSLFYGLFWKVLAQALNTHLITSILRLHTPSLYPYLTNEFVVFGVGFLFSLVLIVIGVIWIFAASGGRVTPGQILQLYIYPLHIAIPAATLMAILQLNQLHGSIHLMITGITVLISIFSLVLTSSDIAPYLQQHRRKFTILGPMLYILSVSGLLAFVLIRTPFLDNILILVQLLD
jgi:hypothetical protein